MKKSVPFIVLLVITVLSGCFIEGTEGGSLSYDGEFNVSEKGVNMSGDIVFLGTNPPQNRYENISIEMYASNGTLLYKEQIGTLNPTSEGVSISVSLSTVPKYIIFDSPDIWDEKTGVDYCVYSSESGVYEQRTAANRSELPITPDG